MTMTEHSKYPAYQQKAIAHQILKKGRNKNIEENTVID